MTPNEIEILIHCHTSPCVHPRIDVLAVNHAIEMLIDMGLIIKINKQDCYTTTLRGKAHIQQICNLEFPKQVFIGSDGKIIEI